MKGIFNPKRGEATKSDVQEFKHVIWSWQQASGLNDTGDAVPDVASHQDVVTEGADEQALDEERRSRSNFRFSLVGLKP
ncbi:MAG TPA: hypothetical protein VEH02_05425, partial [Pseudolabrys sp.]|nr:hypothetical protein [Pseudolabrys sp.]